MKRTSSTLLVFGLGLALAGCTSLSPQLHPTDIAALEQLEDRSEREQAYDDNQIIRVDELRGSRYTKGRRLGARPRGWQSLDLILRSEKTSSASRVCGLILGLASGLASSSFTGALGNSIFSASVRGLAGEKASIFSLQRNKTWSAVF